MISLLAVSAALGAASALGDTRVHHGETLIEWLLSKGGTFNPKLDIRGRSDDPADDPSPDLGIFANDDIPAREVLLRIPQDCLITAGKPEVGDKVQVNYEGEGDWYPARVVSVDSDGIYDVLYDDGDEESDVEPHHIYKGNEGALQCDTVRNLIQEMRLGDKSDFAPYVNYLLDQSVGQLPSWWSDAGKRLLLDLLGGPVKDGIPPFDAVMWSYRKLCRGSDDPLGENAAMLQLQRGWDDVLVPIFDMMSHRNGKWLNAESDPISWSGEVLVRASRDIAAGEEVYTSYNLCGDCGARATDYGTPEILRDYGFVEQYPQRWFLDRYGVSFELDEPETGSSDLVLNWLKDGRPSKAGKPSDMGTINDLEEQLERIKEHEDRMKSPEATAGVPMNELDVIRQYCEALVVALTRAIEAAKTDPDPACLSRDDESGACTVFKSDMTYDELDEEEDDLDYDLYTCEQGQTMNFPGHRNIEQFQSPYQNILFFRHPENRDTCLDLDRTIQICGSYRPHYHEMEVHYTARFLNSVTRVLFVGGGDSMLLHEIIKYPTLELVVGLELDQTVTRKSFKHFGTQPHWDNPRVQWWFGDAAKSLLMLPKDYFGSFDMVLVDLSETVTSKSVTEELDIMEALALLLKPEGILVKNELYLEQMSKLFDYTIQVHFTDVPVVCSQAFIMGSDGVDFLTRAPTDHGVEVLWDVHLKPLEEIEDRYDIYHDYRMNNTRQKKHCGGQDKVDEEPDAQEKSPGIIMIVEAEDATAMPRTPEEMTEAITKALEEEGLKVVSTVASSVDDDGRSAVVIILQEGYVVARTWPEHGYCAFDVHLWSGFDKHESAKAALIAAVGSGGGGKSSSSYRIVAGGMFGVSTWKRDEMGRGPRFTRSCDRPAGSVRDARVDPIIVSVVLEEGMALVRGGDVVVAVVCGERERPCESLEVLKKNGNVREVVVLWTCPSMEDRNGHPSDGSGLVFGCEQEVLKILRESVTEAKNLDAIIVDTSAPIAMGQIVHKVFSSHRNKKLMLNDDIVVIAPMPDKNETWRRNLLDRFRKDIIKYEPVFRAEVLFNSSDSSMEFGVTSSGDTHFVRRLVDMTTSIEKRSGLVSDTRNIQAGLWNFIPDFVPSEFFLPGDYDQTSPLEQWSSQRPLGHQTVFQLEVTSKRLLAGDRVRANFKGGGKWLNGTVVSVNSNRTFHVRYDNGEAESKVERHRILKDDGWPTLDQVKHALSEALSSMMPESTSCPEVHEFSNIGDGCVLVALWSGGMVVALWDGRNHVDINLFTYAESEEDHMKFVGDFVRHVPLLKTVLRDEQPRGYGRVVNFLEDIEPRRDPHWA